MCEEFKLPTQGVGDLRPVHLQVVHAGSMHIVPTNHELSGTSVAYIRANNGSMMGQ